MANKVVTFSRNNNQKQIPNNEIYRDISMMAMRRSVPAKSKQTDHRLMAKVSIDKLQDDVSELEYSNYVDRLVNVNAVKNSLHNIFTWIPGERVLNPEFGSMLRKFLYEGITDFNQEQIIAEIRSSVSQWEPRVRIDKIVKLTSSDDAEDNTVHIRVIYSIPSLTEEQFYYDYSTQTSR